MDRHTVCRDKKIGHCKEVAVRGGTTLVHQNCDSLMLFKEDS